eukprot:TRINITY_DN193_c0_g1_i1.p1 TRINITY_DN193_c0_g1~~TRINITY_DN193_c0_g1_i1.p1  ORF type:complete len:479 (+),score=186.60 TRINITY_DN193_c0_g1_i1:10-1446(+)
MSDRNNSIRDLLLTLARQYGFGFEDEEDEINPRNDTTPCDPNHYLKLQQQIQKSEIAKNIYYKTNCYPGLKQPKIHQLLTQREKMNKRENKRRIQLNISQRFVPNSDFFTLDKLRHQIFCGKFSANGNFFVSACQDHKLRVYDCSQLFYNYKSNYSNRKISNLNSSEISTCWKQIKSLTAQQVGWSIIDIDISKDQQNVIYSTWSDNIGLFKLDQSSTDQIDCNLDCESGRTCFFSIKFSADGSKILAGSSDSKIYIFDLLSNRRILQLSAHNNDVNGVAFLDQSSTTFISASDDGLIKLWDLRQINPTNSPHQAIFSGHIEGVASLAAKGDGTYFISNSKDQTMKLWDLRKPTTANVTINNSPWDYRFDRHTPHYLGGNAVLIGDTSLMTYKDHKVLQTLIRCDFSPLETTGQRYAYTGSYDGQVIVYDLLNGQIVSKLSGHSKLVRDASWHPHLPLIVSSSWDARHGCWFYKPKNQ